MGFGKRWPFPGQAAGQKFKSKSVERNGIKFPSIAEADRWDQLCLAEQAGAITDLKRQVTYQLIVNDLLITSYRADFVYMSNGEKITEDIKGMATPEFKLKFKLMQACLGIKVRVINAKNKEIDPLKPVKAKKKKLKEGEAPKGNLKMDSKTKQTTLKF